MEPVSFVLMGVVTLMGLLKGIDVLQERSKETAKVDEHGFRLEYDPHYTRQLELQEFGYSLTVCECAKCDAEKKAEIEADRRREKELARIEKARLETQQYHKLMEQRAQWEKKVNEFAKKQAQGLGRGLGRCSTCKVPLDYDGWCSNGCVKMPLSAAAPIEQLNRRVDELSRNKANTCTRCGETLNSPDADTCQACVFWEMQRRKNHRVRTRVAKYDGRSYRARMPTEVPANAHVEITPKDFMGYPGDFMWMVFKWTHSETGNQMFLRSMATPVDSVAVYADEREKPVKTYAQMFREGIQAMEDDEW